MNTRTNKLLGIGLTLLVLLTPSFSEGKWKSKNLFKPNMQKVFLVNLGYQVPQGIIMSSTPHKKEKYQIALFLSGRTYRIAKVSEEVLFNLFDKFMLLFDEQKKHQDIPGYCRQRVSVMLSDGWRYKKADAVCFDMAKLTRLQELGDWYREVIQLVLENE